MRADAARLSDVAAALEASPISADVLLSDVHHDSRDVTPGSLFVAIRGANVDGHDLAVDAVSAGAVALIVQRELDLDVPQIVVADSRAALATAAAVVHGHPSHQLQIIGVTGTNGKTTVTHMIEAIARTSGLKTGIIGTLGARVGVREIPVERTTPESSDLQRLLALMVEDAVDLVAMEVSSHALALHRSDEIQFGVAAFTNLSRDHLDFHGDMESYYSEKARLFEASRSRTAAVWIDDASGARIASETKLPVTRVGLGAGADVFASQIEVDSRGSTFSLHIEGREARLRIPVPAQFNIANALLAAAACRESGLSFEQICHGLEALPQVPGRFEVVPGGWRFQAIVDYAHTPGAVTAVIAEARSLTSAGIIAVIGAGGDRDQEKRPLMGAAAATADRIYVTSDNPRSEDPESIVAEVAGGMSPDASVVIEVDRRAAIRAALGAAEDGDIVLILGKGHEQGQEFAEGRVEPFDDRVVVAEEGAALPGTADG
jgi:UDP-N-acetylmuramoyl-L-alanyl-D-glutamate--2,6-diaminopimelate ligase